jgi:hypothetical protein
MVGLVHLSVAFAEALRSYQETCLQMLLFNFLFSCIFAENSTDLLWGEHMPLLCTIGVCATNVLPIQLTFKSALPLDIKLDFEQQRASRTLRHWMFAIWHVVVKGAFLQMRFVDCAMLWM